jgi:hypothetical protein
MSSVNRYLKHGRYMRMVALLSDSHLRAAKLALKSVVRDLPKLLRSAALEWAHSRPPALSGTSANGWWSFGMSALM